MGFGVPFAANPTHEALTPLGWALGLASSPLAFDLYNLLHLLIAGLGAAALARRLGASGVAGPLVAAAALALGGYATSMVPNQLVVATAWTPWVAWAAHRLAASFAAPAERASERIRSTLVLAVAFAPQLAAGEPASVLVAALLAAGVVATQVGGGDRRRLLRSLGATGLAAMAGAVLAAVAVLPALLLLGGSARAAGLDGGGLAWSLHPARLLELVWPMAYGSQLGDGWLAGLLWREGPGDPFWSFSLFVGLPVLCLAWIAGGDRRTRRLLWASLAFTILAAGPHTPLDRLVRPVLLRWVNFPEKFLYGALVLVAAAAGAGFTRWSGQGASRWQRRLLGLGAAALAGAALLRQLRRAAWSESLVRRAADWGVLANVDAGVAAAIRGAWVAAGAAALVWLAWVLAARLPRRAGAALVVFGILAPLVWAAGRTTPFAPRATVAAPPAVLAPLSSAGGASPRPRLLRLDPLRPSGPFTSGEQIARNDHQAIDTNVASRFGVDVLPGFDPAESRVSRRFGREILPRMSELAVVRLLGVDYLATRDPERMNLPFTRVVGRGEDGWTLLTTGEVRPRAFVAPRWRLGQSVHQALDGLAIPGREQDPWLVSIVQPVAAPAPGGEPAPGASPGRCTVTTHSADHLTLDCESAVPGFVVLLDEARPGWSARLDGQPAPIAVADGLFRAVAAPAGGHRVEFIYRTPGLRLGGLVTLLSAVSCGVFLLLPRRSNPVREAETKELDAPKDAERKRRQRDLQEARVARRQKRA